MPPTDQSARRPSLTGASSPLGGVTHPPSSGARKADGPKCRGCRQTEAACAYRNGACCSGCSHWRHLDAAGNERRENRCGTNQGYDRHRYRRERPCVSCRLAHSRHANAQNERRRSA